MDHDAVRIEVARQVVEDKLHDLGAAVIAAGCYGSVAHGAAGPFSDVEIVVVSDSTVPYRDDYFFKGGVPVECTVVPADRILNAATQVPPDWGIKADQCRQHLVLYDPGGLFPRLHQAAHSLEARAFDAALARSWWTAYELRGKVLNALRSGDLPRAVSAAWSFGYWGAMRIALHDQVPYESARTLWSDVTSRSNHMNDLVAALLAGSEAPLEPAIDAVWRGMEGWGSPTSYLRVERE